MTHTVIVPDDADESWNPPGYQPGPDDPGPVTSVHDHGESEGIEEAPDAEYLPEPERDE